MEILRAQDVRAYYQLPGERPIWAVDGVSLELRSGEVLGIAGESGCGKSTLASILALNVQRPLVVHSGEVRVGSRDALEMDEETVRKEIRGKYVSVVPQGAMNSLNPTIRVRQFAFDLLRAHDPDITKEEAVGRTRERLEMLSLPSRVLDLYPHQLSGGMKQRVVMVLSTLLNPQVLIADEPTSALDVSSQKVVIRLLLELLEREIIKSVVFITHELPLLRHVATRIAVMYAGRLVEMGQRDEVVFDPAHPYTEALVGSVLVVESEVRKSRVQGIPGAPPDLRDPPEGCRFYSRCSKRMERCTVDPPEFPLGGRRVWCWLHDLPQTEEKAVGEADTEPDRESNTEMDREADREMDGEAAREVDREADRETDRDVGGAGEAS